MAVHAGAPSDLAIGITEILRKTVYLRYKGRWPQVRRRRVKAS